MPTRATFSFRRSALPALVIGLLAGSAQAATVPPPAGGLYLGADLSYVNEMDDCGAVFRKGGQPADPFVLMQQAGGNTVRVRIWNDARWTDYSDLGDVSRTIRRARALGMQVLLDFHYSDDWADGDKQHPPAAWAGMSVDEQAEALYQYTLKTLATLDARGLMPEMVQVGNETNPELMGGEKKDIDWVRNAKLFNAGIRAVRDAGRDAAISPRVMLHIAQPENVLPWFEAATKAGVVDYDMIGISYYRKWSKRTLPELGETIRATRDTYRRDVILVETAYPFTNDGEDAAGNLLGPDTLIAEYPATPQGQRDYLVDLTRLVVRNGGNGVVYWEPAWLSSACTTRWGTGSNWENAAWFDLRTHEALPAFEFMGIDYSKDVDAGRE